MAMTRIDHRHELPNHERVELGPDPFIHPGCRIVASELGSWTEIGAGCTIEESSVGEWSYLSPGCDLIYTELGRFCSIAAGVRINPGNHPMHRVTQHHATYRRARYRLGHDDPEFFAGRRAKRCHIGHDVWIGHAAIVMPGVHIGHGAVIGSGAVVTRDIPAYAIAVGVPARVLRMRFDDSTVAALLRIRWWDWDDATLRRRFDEFYDTAAFIAAYG